MLLSLYPSLFSGGLADIREVSRSAGKQMRERMLSLPGESRKGSEWNKRKLR